MRLGGGFRVDVGVKELDPIPLFIDVLILASVGRGGKGVETGSSGVTDALEFDAEVLAGVAMR